MFSLTGLQACTYPGSIIGGRSTPVKFYYAVGEKVFFECDLEYELLGARMLQCLGSGKWSTTIPTCITTSSKDQGHHGSGSYSQQQQSKRKSRRMSYQ